MLGPDRQVFNANMFPIFLVVCSHNSFFESVNFHLYFRTAECHPQAHTVLCTSSRRMFALQNGPPSNSSSKEVGNKEVGNNDAKEEVTYRKLAIVSTAFFGLLAAAKSAAYAIKKYRVCVNERNTLIHCTNDQ